VSLSPASAPAGTSPLTLTVDGLGFASGATVRWNGSPRATTFVSPTRVLASIGAADLAAPADALVTVANPSGLAAPPMTFVIDPPPVPIGAGTSGVVWRFASISGAAMESGLPTAVSAAFSWDNTRQGFLFWFRGFPSSMNTLTAIQPGMYVLFQSSGPATINGARASAFVLPNPGGTITTVQGTTGALWSGSPGGLPANQVAVALPDDVTAIFHWDAGVQAFLFWFRGFPASMNTLLNGLQRAEFYFFQAATAGLIIHMD